MFTNLYHGMCRAALVVAVLFLAPAASDAAAPRQARANHHPAKKTPPASLIEIQFADRSIPAIRETNVATPQPYGIYDTEADQRARDRVAVLTPPPDLNAYALQWESHENHDAQLFPLAANTNWNWTWSQWEGVGGWHGWNDWCDYPFGILRLHILGRAFHPTPADSHPAYNLTEYNAALAEWRRGLERAAKHGVLPTAAKTPARLR